MEQDLPPAHVGRSTAGIAPVLQKMHWSLRSRAVYVWDQLLTGQRWLFSTHALEPPSGGTSRTTLNQRSVHFLPGPPSKHVAFLENSGAEHLIAQAAPGRLGSFEGASKNAVGTTWSW